VIRKYSAGNSKNYMDQYSKFNWLI
jgi:hypothetical protein